MIYRKELDGLRALAVLSVIVYHANIKIFGIDLFKGGFFGVDIFFVLSGYLITGIVRNQMEAGTFSLMVFYWRRIKRIIPALLAVLTVTSILAHWTLLPNDLVKYTESLKTALYFGSNYYFYNEDSYTALASIYKPLLHTWSLAVEWQYYLIFPIVIWFINRFFRQYQFGLLFALALVSLHYANYIVPDYPDMAFYLLPSRAWELLLGGLVTFYNRENIFNVAIGSLESFIYKALPMLGLYLVTYSLISIGDDVMHPSFITLIPVLGTCLVIMFSHKGEVVNDTLSLKPFVFIGLISYSMYLWHQPIFVFFRFLKYDHSRYEQLLFVMLISILLPFITYKLIESRYKIKRVKIWDIISLIILIFGLVLFSHLTIKNEGYPEKLKGLVKDAYEMYQYTEFQRLEDQTNVGMGYGSENSRAQCNMRTVNSVCKFGDQSWITIGDSYVGQLDFALKDMLSKKKQGMISYAYEQCPFVSSSIWFGNVPECSVVNEERLKAILSFEKGKNIIIAANYDQFDRSKRKTEAPIQNMKDGFKGGVLLKTDIAWVSYSENINSLLKAGHNVYVIYPIPHPGFFEVKNLVFSQIRKNKTASSLSFTPVDSYDKNAYKNAMEKTEKLDQYLPEHPNLHKVISADVFCPEKKCKIINESGGLYNGGPHLSTAGARLLLSSFISIENANKLSN